MKTILAAVCIVGAAGMSMSDVVDSANKLMRKESRDIQEHHQRGDPNAAWPVQQESSAICDDVFPIGLTNETLCSTAGVTYFQIDSMTMCEEAAARNGNKIQKMPDYFEDIFEIPAEDFSKYPVGCFQVPCRPPDTGLCYYYNDVGDASVVRNPTGEAICVEYKYTDGRHTQTGDGIDCNDGYSDIDDEDVCLEAAECLGRCTGHEFRVAEQNTSMYHDYPRGCFKHPSLMTADGKYCVFFNPDRDLTGNPLPSRPKGTPVCDVTSRRHETLAKIAAQTATDAPTAAPR